MQERNFMNSENYSMRYEELVVNPTEDFNKVLISGIISKEFEYYFSNGFEDFYQAELRVARYSGTNDIIPIVASGRLLESSKINGEKNKYVEIEGRFYSYNEWGNDGKRHLNLYVAVLDIQILDNDEGPKRMYPYNYIYLDGYVCKEPVHRITPLGKIITDLFIAVHSTRRRCDYIPCIAWNDVAKYAEKFEIGDRIQLFGRIQSREYYKKNPLDSETSEDSEEGQFRRVNEVSIMKLWKV